MTETKGKEQQRGREMIMKRMETGQQRGTKMTERMKKDNG